MGNGSVLDAEVALYHRARHGETLLFVRVTLEVVPPVAAHHDCEFCAASCVLTFNSRGVPDYAKSALGVLLEWNSLWDEVAETFIREKVWIGEVEVYCHDRGEGGNLVVLEGGDGEIE